MASRGRDKLWIKTIAIVLIVAMLLTFVFALIVTLVQMG